MRGLNREGTDTEFHYSSITGSRGSALAESITSKANPIYLPISHLRYTLNYSLSNILTIMNQSEKLLDALSKSVNAGGGVHSASELAFMIGVNCNSAFRKFLADCVKRGLIRRVAKGVYESVITPPDPTTAIYKVIKKLRHSVLSYISLESQLSYTGDISQIMMDRVTVMTKGRSGCFSTPYGVIEFIHTKQSVEQIESNVYFDPDIKIYRAHREQALADLSHCQRNQHMLEG